MHLREFLKQNSFSERQFAKKIGVSQQHLNFILRGLRTPSLELARRIIEATEGKVNIGDLSNPEAPTRLKKVSEYN